jgi:hypothetical protein
MALVVVVVVAVKVLSAAEKALVAIQMRNKRQRQTLDSLVWGRELLDLIALRVVFPLPTVSNAWPKAA